MAGYVRTFLCLCVALGGGVIAGAGAEEKAASPTIQQLDPNMAVKDSDGAWLWYDAREMCVEGKGWGDTKAFYDRLPAKAEGEVRDPVWKLSRHSAGLAIRFTSNASTIAARWNVTDETLAMPHMPATGVSGLDLYVKDGAQWRWIGAGRPSAITTQAVLAEGIPAGDHEYMVYLPLYMGRNRCISACRRRRPSLRRRRGRRKGYGPSSSTAPPLRRGDALPGRAWRMGRLSAVASTSR